MEEYISKKKAIALIEARAEMGLGTPKQVFFAAAKMLEKIPAADVRPVIYAHWTTDHPDKRNKEWHCSNCKFEPQVFENTNLCPNCGAVMDGGSNG